MWRVLTSGRGVGASRLATAASQCSLPRWTWTTSAVVSMSRRRRTSCPSAMGCTPPASVSVVTRWTPSARARSITFASVPARQASVTTWPRRSSSRVIRAAQ